MSNESFFTISGLACAKHTPETAKKWQLWQGLTDDDNRTVPASITGKRAIISMATKNGYRYDDNVSLSDNSKLAFEHLSKRFLGATKSWILRTAILDYQPE